MASLEMDRIPYTCSRCLHVTFAPPGHVAITCENCGVIDLGTELARRRWQTVAEIQMVNKPTTKPVPPAKHRTLMGSPLLVAGIALAILVLAAVAVELVLR
jgi:hypothetical protein